MTVKRQTTINPDDYVFIFDDHIVDGYINGTQVGIVYTNDAFTPYKGNDGESARVMTNDTSATITLTISQISPSNDVFSEKLSKDLSTGNEIVDVSFKDNRGTTVLDGSGAYILKFADVTVSNTIEARTWRIYASYLEGTIGGNFL